MSTSSEAVEVATEKLVDLKVSHIVTPSPKQSPSPPPSPTISSCSALPYPPVGRATYLLDRGAGRYTELVPADELRAAGVELMGVPGLRGADGGVVVATTSHYGIRYSLAAGGNAVVPYNQVCSFSDSCMRVPCLTW